MTKKLPFFILFIFTTFLACENKEKGDDPVPKDKPAFEATSATTYEDGGVTLEGVVNSIDPEITDYGFMISSDSSFTQSNFYFMDTEPRLGNFQKNVFARLDKDKRYYFTVFTKKGQQVKTFNKLSFVSTGSKTIRIEGISKVKGHLEDTLSIYGKYFSAQSVYIQFGKHVSTTIQQNDSILTCIVPGTLDEVNPIITLNYTGKSDIVSKAFTLFKPEVLDFTKTGTFRDTVIINGDHFDQNTYRVEVKFGNIAAEVVKASRKQLKVILPDELESVSTKVTVKAQLQTNSGQSNFVLLKPVLTEIPSKGFTRGQITIKGKYFHPIAFRNQEFLGQITMAFFAGILQHVGNGRLDPLRRISR